MCIGSPFVSLHCLHVCHHIQREILRQKELQAQQLEEQRAQFKMRTLNLLQFREQSPEPKAKTTRKKVIYISHMSLQCEVIHHI